jgi:hypothetical protein
MLNKFCQICKSNKHNKNHCPSNIVNGRFPSREIVPIHVVQVEVLVIQEQQQQHYEAPPQHNRFVNQQYNGQNWRG